MSDEKRSERFARHLAKAARHLAEVARLCSEQPEHDCTEATIAAKGEGYSEGAGDVIAKVEAWWGDNKDYREADALVADLRREFDIEPDGAS